MTFTLQFDTDIDAALRDRVSDSLDGLRLDEVAGEVLVSVLTGGAMNQNFVLDSGGERFVLRLAGSQVDRFGVDRARGVAMHRVWEHAGVSPRLLGITLPVGDCVSQFLPARTLDAGILGEPGVVAACAEVVAVAHHTPLIDGGWSIFDDFRRYAMIAREEGLALPDDFAQLRRALDRIDLALGTADIPQVMAHNDLQIQNYMIGADGAWLIDLEYAAPADPYLDLGMLAGYGRLDADGRRTLLTTYFGLHRSTDERRLDVMYFAAAMREAIWSVCAQPVLGDVTGWDYAAWGGQFFDKARALLHRTGFDEGIDLAGAAADDDRAFAQAAERAAIAAPTYQARRATREEEGIAR